MYISSSEEGKNTKYNHVAPIDLDTIPKEELEQALMEFAEGSLGLEKCLREMWKNGLKTIACCAGNNDPYEIAYIAMAEGVDIFSYLSSNLLSNDMVALESENNQVIRFAGFEENKEKLMFMLAEDISTGKKNNMKQVKEKMGKPINLEWQKEANIYYMRKAGLTEEKIAFELYGMELRYKMAHGTEEERKLLKLEYEKYWDTLLEKGTEKYRNRK